MSCSILITDRAITRAGNDFPSAYDDRAYRHLPRARSATSQIQCRQDARLVLARALLIPIEYARCLWGVQMFESFIRASVRLSLIATLIGEVACKDNPTEPS